MNCGERGRTAVDSNSLKRGRYGLLRTGVDYPRRPFKEEVMGSNPIRATEDVRELVSLSPGNAAPESWAAIWAAILFMPW